MNIDILGKHYINNQWIQGKGKCFSSINPANGESIWEGYSATSEDVDHAIYAARDAFGNWSTMPLEKRIQYMIDYSEVLKAGQENLAHIISSETGKPLWESRNEVSAMINKVNISINAYHQRCPNVIKEQKNGLSVTRHKPHGTVAILGPYNFPGHLPNGHIIPALIAGNTVVFKPSELTPLVAEITMQFWKNANLPPGVINMVQGGSETGQYIARHPEISGLYFTGSYQTGKALAEIYAAHPEKILALELGGNNPLVITTMTNPLAAAYTVIQSAFISSGQRCTCARRLIVCDSEQSEDFIKKLVSLTKQIIVGSFDSIPEPFMGPIISENAAFKVLGSQSDLIANGGVPLLEMRKIKNGTGFLSPGIIDMTHAVERPDIEIFGPLLQLIRVPDFGAAIQEANKTTYGLAAGLISSSVEEFETFLQRVHAGVINWNMPLTGASSEAPFGGIKSSGNHRPSALYAADYCAYPVVSMESTECKLPESLPPGLPK